MIISLVGNSDILLAKACTQDDECADGQWCAEHTDGSKFCKDYATLGASCDTFTSPEDTNICDPQVHFCYKPNSCILQDDGGTCQPKSFKFVEGDCCSTNDDCASNICQFTITHIGTKQKTCQASSSSEVEEDIDIIIIPAPTAAPSSVPSFVSTTESSAAPTASELSHLSPDDAGIENEEIDSETHEKGGCQIIKNTMRGIQLIFGSEGSDRKKVRHLRHKR